MGGVGVIEKIHRGAGGRQRLEGGETAEAAVENSDRTVVHESASESVFENGVNTSVVAAEIFYYIEYEIVSIENF